MKWTPRGLETALLMLLVLPYAEADEMDWQPVGGSIGQMFWGYFQPINGATNFEDRADAQLDLGLSHPRWRAQLSPGLTLYAPAGVGGATQGQARVYADLKEGWLEFREPAWDLRVGNQLISWGAADRVNPSDTWNPTDLTDPFLSRKLPLLTGRASLHPESTPWLGLELLFSPFFRESRLPVLMPEAGAAPAAVSITDSRWLLPFPTRLAASGAGNSTVPLYYQLAAPTFAQQTWQGGARLKLSPLERWDFSVSYQNTVERLPRFALSSKGNASDPNLPVTITLSPSYHREQVLGVDGSGAVFEGAVILRFEAAYHVRDNSDIALSQQQDLLKNDFVHAVGGFDYTLPWRVLGVTTYLDTMAVVYQTVGSNSESVGQSTLSGLPDALPWDRDWVIYVENRLSPRYKLATSVVWSLQNQDVFLSSGLSARLGDHLQASVDGDFFLGSRTGFYGQFNDNSRVRFSTVLVF